MERYYINKYDYNYEKFEEHKKEYDNLDLESYERGWDDGCNGSHNADVHNMASLICEYWDDFTEALRDCEQRAKNEMELYNNVVEYLKEELECE